MKRLWSIICFFYLSMSIAVAHEDHGVSVINMSEQGFSSTTVKISQEDFIIFYNIGNEDHWPASDIHPTHKIYPEFDSKKEIPSGQSFIFMFERSGTWDFHDHLNPQFRGSIIVEETEDPNKLTSRKIASRGNAIIEFYHKTKLQLLKFYFKNFPKQFEKLAGDPLILLSDVIDWCKKKETFDERYGCYKKELEDGVDYGGTKVSLEVLDKFLKEDREILTFCHPLSHVIGRETFKNQGSVLNAFSECNEVCASGCYHGVMERSLIEFGFDENRIVSICEDNALKNDFYKRFQCLHGFGHGFMFYYGNDMFTSLAKCDIFESEWGRSSCYGGVFMENIVALDTDHHLSNLNENDPHYPCNALEDRYKADCYFSISDWFLKLYDYDFKKVFKECDNAPQEHVWNCYRGIGRGINWYTKHDINKTRDLCNLGSKENRKYCVRGAVIDFVETWKNAGAEAASKFCRIVEREDKPDCYLELGSLMTVLDSSADGRTSLCSIYSEEAYLPACLVGARIWSFSEINATVINQIFDNSVSK